jgi:hypothetical protein
VRKVRARRVTGSDEPQCPLLNVAMCGRTPIEWFPQGDEDGTYRRDDQYHCLMFRDRDDPGAPAGARGALPGSPGQDSGAPRIGRLVTTNGLVRSGRGLT